ncbi:MAG: aldehyde ferredoxin oxidoreductase C-terminal domain-containing protein [Anaerolineales bacterium]
MEEKVVRVDVAKRQVRHEAVPPGWTRLGGRGLIPRILLDESDPLLDPLGPDARLIWAPGLLVGHMLSSSDRISVGGKSPLTGGIKESNAGGTTGLRLAYLGIKAVIVEGSPKDDQPQILLLNKGGGTFEPAGDLAGMGVYQAGARLVERFGKKRGCILIGPGGEMQLTAAGILNLDKDLEPSRINARGGMGAVMGAKGLKAIIIDDTGGERPPLHNPALFKAAQKYFTKELLAHPQTRTYEEYSTAAMTMMCNTFGGLPTRSFTAGSFEGAEKISGESLRETLLARGGDSEPSHACMPGCVIRCSNCFGDSQGKRVVSPIEYETIGLMGSNLGIDSLDAIAILNREANDLGLDSIELGAALGVAADAGLMEYGDLERALELIGEIRLGTELGRALGNGAAAAGEFLGVERVPVAKRQAISAYDPRAIKGTGVTYATSPQGADHTAGLTIRAKIDHLDPKGQAEVSRASQVSMAGYDTLGVCIFAGFGFAKAPGAIRDLLNARYGWDVGDDILKELGEETLRLERAFNKAAGFTKDDDRLPAWLSREPLPPHNAVFDVSDEDLDRVFGE